MKTKYSDMFIALMLGGFVGAWTHLAYSDWIVYKRIALVLVIIIVIFITKSIIQMLENA